MQKAGAVGDRRGGDVANIAVLRHSGDTCCLIGRSGEECAIWGADFSAAGAVQHDQAGGLGGRGLKACGVGHIQHKVTPAAGAQRAHQQGAPVRGSGIGAGIGIARHGRTIDKVAVLLVVGRCRQSGEAGNHALGHVGDFFGAILRREAMQHAIVAAHVNHGGAVFVGFNKVAIPIKGIAACRGGGVPHFRIHNIALAALALAIGFAFGVVGGVGTLFAAIAANVIQPVLACGGTLVCAIGGFLQGQFLGGAQVGLVGRPNKRHPSLGCSIHPLIAPAQNHARSVRGQGIKLVGRVLSAPRKGYTAIGIDCFCNHKPFPAALWLVVAGEFADTAARNIRAAQSGRSNAGADFGVNGANNLLECFFQIFAFFYGVELAPAIDGGVPHVLPCFTAFNRIPLCAARRIISKTAVVAIRQGARGGD